MVTVDLRHFASTSLFLFTGELFYILGVALAGPVTASLWQPSQPVFTLIFAACAGVERFSMLRCFGILLTVGACVGMLGGAVAAASHGSDDGRHQVAGNVCLLLNCMSTPAYILVSRPLLARQHTPIVLAATTFWGCSLCFACAVGVSALALTPVLGNVQWPNARGLVGCVYIALVSTALPFPLQFFANKHLNASLVSAYYALQPLAAVALTLLVTAVGLADLRRPAPSDLLGLGTIFGLAVVVTEELRSQQAGGDGQLLDSSRNGRRTAVRSDTFVEDAGDDSTASTRAPPPSVPPSSEQQEAEDPHDADSRL